MKAVKVIKRESGQEKVIYIAHRLANNSSYMTRHELERAATIEKEEEDLEVSPVDGSGGSAETDVREDILSSEPASLIGKYDHDVLVGLAKELGLRGNHQKTGQEKLIVKIKEKLAE